MDKKERNKKIVSIWTDLIEAGMKLKKKRFDKDRKDVMRFYAGDHSFIYDEAESAGWVKNESWAQMTINLTFELIEVFGPILYQKKPDTNDHVSHQKPNSCGLGERDGDVP